MVDHDIRPHQPAYGQLQQATQQGPVAPVSDAQTPPSPGSAVYGPSVLPESSDEEAHTKKEAALTLQASDSTSLNLADRKAVDYEQPRDRPWKPTFMRLGPLAGLVAMFLAMGSLVAALGVLVASDGRPVPEWYTAEPSIILAVCTAVANLLIRYACMHPLFQPPSKSCTS